jgi:hypothetical protein
MPTTQTLADVALPPTFVIDFLYLGIPAGLIAGAALLAAVVSLIVVLRRRGLPIWAAAVAGLLVYGVANFGFYLYGAEQNAARRRQERQHLFPSPNSGASQPQPTRPSLPPPTSP